MKICGIKQTLPGVVEVTPDTGSAFFLRISYLKQVKEEQLLYISYGAAAEQRSVEFSDEEAADILNAALVYSAEVAAMTYLARAEQSRFGLTQKLLHKSIDKHAVSEALDYLESVHYLDDERFAAAWLRSRSIDHAEGRIRLSAELASRGISKQVANSVLKEFFSEHDEQELCERAYRKCIRVKKDDEKIRSALLRNGFTSGEIKKVMTGQIE